MKSKIVASILMSSLFVFNPAFADDSTPAAGADGGAAAGGSNFGAGEAMMLGSMSSGLAAAAGENEGAQYLGAAVNIGVGGYMVKGSCGQEGKGVECAMGAMMVAQGGLTANAAGQTGKTADGLGNNDYGLEDYDVPNTAPDIDGLGDIINASAGGGGAGTINGDDLPNLADNLLQQAANAGVSVSPDGKSVTIAGKGTFPSSVLGDQQALLDAGFDPAMVNGMFDKMNKATAAAQARLKLGNGRGLAGGGGGGRPRTTIKFEDDLSNPFDGLFAKNKKGKKAKASGVSGLQKILPGGDAIGVAQDNIFEMIHRRYKILKETRNGFFVEP